jgi:hypothetical protein
VGSHDCGIFFPILIVDLCDLQGEEYKLIWPKQQEFVRMAARFGATIVPFGAVGEDDIAEVSMRHFLSRNFAALSSKTNC